MSEKPNPPIGSLTDRVQLARKETVAETEGGHTALFLPLGSVWGRVRALSARQAHSADGSGVAISHSVVLRFRADLKPGDRITYRGRRLDVVSAEDLNGKRAFLSCACAETAFTG